MNKPALSMSFSSPQGEVRYGVSGAGPDVVLVHGTPWSSYTWHRVIPALAQHYRVHYYDLPGYGQSEKRADQRVSLDVQGEVFNAFVHQLGLERPCVIAHDFGGAISLRAHLLHGCDYDRLMLIDVVAMAPWGSPFFAHVQRHEAAFAGVPAYIHEAIVERYIRGALYLEPDDSALKALVQPWLGEDGQSGFYRQIAQASQSFTDEIEPLYGSLRCPTTILWGEQDAWIPLETGVRLHHAMAGSTFVSIPDAGHLAQLDAPEVVIAEALAFLSR